MAVGEEILNFYDPDDTGNKTPYTMAQVAEWPMAKLIRMIDWLADGIVEEFEDIFLCAAGTAQALNVTYDAYKTGVGQEGQVWNTQASFIKNRFHTNMARGGQFPYGQTTLIIGMEVFFVPYPATPAAVGSSGTIGTVTSSVDHGTQTTGYNATAFALNFLEQNVFEFRYDENEYQENGKLRQLPCTIGFSGWGAAGNNNLFQNAKFGGSPLSPIMRGAKMLGKEEPFFVRLTPLSTLAIPLDARGWFRFRVVSVGGRRSKRAS